MTRRGVVHDSTCWGVVAASLTAGALTYYEAMAGFEQVAAEAGLDLSVPAPPTPPLWIAVTSGALTVLVVGLCFSRRVRTRLGLRASLSEPSTCGPVYLGAAALYLFTRAIAVAGCHYLDWWRWLPILHVRWCAIGFALLYAFAGCRSVRTPRADWGWSRGRGVLRELVIGAILGLVFVPTLVYASRADTGVFGSYRFFSSVIAAPLVEETVYRGMLYRHLRDRWAWPVAVVASSAIFAAVHMPIAVWPSVFVSGVVFALLREWRGSLLAPIAAHAYGNLFWVLLDARGAG